MLGGCLSKSVEALVAQYVVYFMNYYLKKYNIVNFVTCFIYYDCRCSGGSGGVIIIICGVVYLSMLM